MCVYLHCFKSCVLWWLGLFVCSIYLCPLTCAYIVALCSGHRKTIILSVVSLEAGRQTWYWCMLHCSLCIHECIFGHVHVTSGYFELTLSVSFIQRPVSKKSQQLKGVDIRPVSRARLSFLQCRHLCCEN